MTFKEIEQFWLNELKDSYDDREASNLFFWTVEDVLGLRRTELLAKRNEMLPDTSKSELLRVLQELKNGLPYQHIVGFTYFGNLRIKTSVAALIPRPETEELVHWIAEVFAGKEKLVVEDFCTGTACIALSLKHLFSAWEVYASDFSDAALVLACENASDLKLEITIRKEDVLHPVQNEKLDILVANPPYIPDAERAEMHNRVVNHEPEMALFVPDNDPLLFYRELGKIGLQRLNSSGAVFFELHENFALEIQQMMQELGYKNVQVREDLQGKLRMLCAFR